jgi:hypothetical protein
MRKCHAEEMVIRAVRGLSVPQWLELQLFESFSTRIQGKQDHDKTTTIVKKVERKEETGERV